MLAANRTSVVFMLQVRLWFKVQRHRRFHKEQLQLMKGHARSLSSKLHISGRKRNFSQASVVISCL